MANKMVSLLEGNMPLILTVPHDGRIGKLFETEIPIRRPKRQNDAGTRFLSIAIHYLMKEKYGFYPFVLIQNLERKRLRYDIILHFYKKVLEKARACLDKWNRAYIVDLHAFQNRPKFGNFDIILGTNHRNTVNDDFDLCFGEMLDDFTFYGESLFNASKFNVYIPGRESRNGEKFCASKKSTLVRWITDREPKASALQCEIYKDWFVNYGKMDNLARVFSLVLFQTAV